MSHKTLAVLLTCLPTLAWALAADRPEPSAPLSAAQIVDRSVEARGGLDAWRKLKTMVWIGHIVSADATTGPIRFQFQFKRPDRSRFEMLMQNQPTARIYDGAHGWKVMSTQSGPPQMEAFGAEDLRFARDAGGIDGPLVDYAAKGIAVALEGRDAVDGHAAYRLALTFPTGDVQHVWIDAASYLELKYDRETSDGRGNKGVVAVYYRDYKTVDGLKMPTTIESRVGQVKVADKMVIDRIALDTPLDNRLFARPNLLERRRTTFGAPPRRLPAGAMPRPVTAAGGR